MINALNDLCGPCAGYTLTETVNFGALNPAFTSPSLRTIVFVEVKPGTGCKWKIDKNVCQAQFRRIIHDCDTNTENSKQGGTIEGDCLRWRLDPRADP